MSLCGYIGSTCIAQRFIIVCNKSFHSGSAITRLAQEISDSKVGVSYGNLFVMIRLIWIFQFPTQKVDGNHEKRFAWDIILTEALEVDVMWGQAHQSAQYYPVGLVWLILLFFAPKILCANKSIKVKLKIRAQTISDVSHFEQMSHHFALFCIFLYHFMPYCVFPWVKISLSCNGKLIKVSTHDTHENNPVGLFRLLLSWPLKGK